MPRATSLHNSAPEMVSDVRSTRQTVAAAKRKTGKSLRRTTKSLTRELALMVAEQLELRGDSEDVAELFGYPRPVVQDCALVKLLRSVRHLEAMAYLRGSAEVPLFDGFGKRKPMGRVVAMPARSQGAA